MTHISFVQSCAEIRSSPEETHCADGCHTAAGAAAALLPGCRPAAPAFSAGCSPVPDAPLQSGHWELQKKRDMLLTKLLLPQDK